MDINANPILGRLRPFGKALLFAFLVAVSIAVFGVLLGEYRYAVASESWPSTQGEVLSSAVRRSGRTRWAAVRYSYRVGGKEMVGARVRYVAPVALEWASTTVSRYPAGTPVTVYYDPEQPRESVLEPGRRAAAFAAAVGANLLILGLAVAATFAAVRELGFSA